MPLTTPSILLSLALLLPIPLAVSPTPIPAFPSWDDPKIAKHMATFQAASASNKSPFGNNLPDMADLVPGAWKTDSDGPRFAPLPPLPAPFTVADHDDQWYYPDEANGSVAVEVVEARGEREAAPPRPTEAPRPMPKRVVELKGTVVVGRPRTRTAKEGSRPTFRMEVSGRNE
ncbi:hypothetical protein B0T18DRAFT_428122 [Schizothecium vesticola]|uniref:Uncharacterized protein n=1 Tax=Schizothecium vesticola TaxID=314040 RepID=A0AA40F2P7_9PEZI|nr:hypothetical protein B0T18DRAFT_428122 [Schizothecium vesticola]